MIFPPNIPFQSVQHQHATQCSIYLSTALFLFCPFPCPLSFPRFLRQALSACVVLTLQLPFCSLIYVLNYAAIFFPLIGFGGPEALFYLFSSAVPQRTACSGVTSQMAAHLRIARRRLPDLNRGRQVYSLVLLPMSHRCSLMSHHYAAIGLSSRLFVYSICLSAC